MHHFFSLKPPSARPGRLARAPRLAAWLLPLAGACAHGADAPLTVYGLIDVGVARQTGTSPGGGRTLSLQQGNEGFLSGSRLGVKGSEDLGGGLRVGYVLENGFLANSGAMDQQGQIFGRQAYVSVSGAAGQLSLGRQYTSANLMLYHVDPLGLGATATNSWPVFMTGQRFNHLLNYSNTSGPWQLLAQYAPGQQGGPSRAGTSFALGLKYAQAPSTAVVDLQQTRDFQARTARVQLVGLKQALGDWRLYANLMDSRRDPGFDASDGGRNYADITSLSTPVGPDTNAAMNSVFEGPRRDRFWTLGLSHQPDAVWTFTAGFMRNRTTAPSFDGRRSTFYLVADHRLSPRTDLYLAWALDRVGGDWSGLFGNHTRNWQAGSGTALDGNTRQNLTMFGLRHVF